MDFILRGIRNSFRNLIRTFSIVIILAISIGLALVMLLSLKAVQQRISSVKGSIGNLIMVSPAGARGFEGGGEPLTETDVASIKSLSHITKVDETLNDRLAPSSDTTLQSAIEPGTLGQRAGRGFRNFFGNGNSQNFQIPISVTGTTDLTNAVGLGGGSLKVISGNTFDTTADQAVSLVGSSLAGKNSLSVGSTFTAYNTSFKVVGIFDAGNQFSNSGMFIPLKTLQRLSSQSGQISSARVEVDSINNLSSSVDAIKSKLGSKADVVSQQDTSSQALAPLESIQNVALYGLIGSLAAGSIIVFLTMLMIVRERRREIGVLKAIGAPNNKIMLQFIAEALTLSFLGGFFGFLGGLFLSNPILSILINSSASTANQQVPGGFRNFARFAGIGQTRTALTNLHTIIGLDLLFYGAIAILIIAVVGSAVPSWFISKIRPAEVLRGDF